MPNPKGSFNTNLLKAHYTDRLFIAAKSMRDVGILVAAGSIEKTQQTFVDRAVRTWDLRGAHVSAGGIYISYSPNDPGYKSLQRRNIVADASGYITVPIYQGALSEQNREELKRDLTLTHYVDYSGNKADLTGEGNSGIQKSFGEKKALEQGISSIKTRSTLLLPIGAMTMIAIDRTVEMSSNSTTKMKDKIAELARDEKKIKQGSARGSISNIQAHIAALEVRISVFSDAKQLLHDRAPQMIFTEQQLFESEREARAKIDTKITAGNSSFRAK